ncbi:hypothetical protein B0H10DRAFT_2120470 [Mycena sp. CBHHK59/15]|nr:hypothetical protein B0H10DRAFT_2120470 [Mycena sp. CBHHK59/15]
MHHASPSILAFPLFAMLSRDFPSTLASPVARILNATHRCPRHQHQTFKVMAGLFIGWTLGHRAPCVGFMDS